MIVIYQPVGINNFHHRPAIRVRTTVNGVVSARIAKRIMQHFCGVAECLCGAGGVRESSWDSLGRPTEYTLAATCYHAYESELDALSDCSIDIDIDK